MLDCSNYSALEMELLQSCTKPSMYMPNFQYTRPLSCWIPLRNIKTHFLFFIINFSQRLGQICPKMSITSPLITWRHMEPMVLIITLLHRTWLSLLWEGLMIGSINMCIWMNIYIYIYIYIYTPTRKTIFSTHHLTSSESDIVSFSTVDTKGFTVLSITLHKHIYEMNIVYINAIAFGVFFIVTVVFVFHIIIINPLSPSKVLWWHILWSTLAQVMACYLTTPSYCLNQS